MSIVILKPDPAHCRPFYIAQQLQTAAWGWGDTETEARARMMELRRNGRLLYKPEAEEATYEAALELVARIDHRLRYGKIQDSNGQRLLYLGQVTKAIVDGRLEQVF